MRAADNTKPASGVSGGRFFVLCAICGAAVSAYAFRSNPWTQSDLR